MKNTGMRTSSQTLGTNTSLNKRNILEHDIEPYFTSLEHAIFKISLSHSIYHINTSDNIMSYEFSSFVLGVIVFRFTYKR